MGEASISALPVEPGVGLLAAIVLVLAIALSAVAMRQRRSASPAVGMGAEQVHVSLPAPRSGSSAERKPYTAPGLVQSAPLETRAGSPFEPGSDPSDPLWPDG
jgi:hypothetical protein